MVVGTKSIACKTGIVDRSWWGWVQYAADMQQIHICSENQCPCGPEAYFEKQWHRRRPCQLMAIEAFSDVLVGHLCWRKHGRDPRPATDCFLDNWKMALWLERKGNAGKNGKKTFSWIHSGCFLDQFLVYCFVYVGGCPEASNPLRFERYLNQFDRRNDQVTFLDN